MKVSKNSHWLPESWFELPPSTGEAAAWNICRDCLSPLAEFFERLVDGWDGGCQLIERVVRPRMLHVQFTGSQIYEALRFLETRWNTTPFFYREGVKITEGRVVERIERADLGFAHTWLSVNVSYDFARHFRRMVRTPYRTVLRNDEWWRSQTQKVERNEPIGPDFVLSSNYEDVGAQLWLELVRTANFLRRATIVLEAQQTKKMPSAVAIEAGVKGTKWSAPDNPSQWAKVYGMGVATFKKMVDAKTIRVKKMTDRKICIHVDDLPPGKNRTSK